LSEQFRPNLYEGIDFSVSPADFWKKFKRLN
jgi:hypothetical protein